MNYENMILLQQKVKNSQFFYDYMNYLQLYDLYRLYRIQIYIVGCVRRLINYV